MIVELDLQKHTCRVERQKGDPRFHSSNWALAESTFLYHVLKELKKQGYDVIKKRMWKDGHMVDDTQQYIRTRKWTTWEAKGEFAIYNLCYATYDAGERFNEAGEVYLGVLTD
jgi:hypothetical protein